MKAILILLLAAGVAAGAPAPKKKPAAAPAAAPAKAPPKETKESKEKTFDFAAMGIEGKVLAPQLLYLLGRIKVELDKDSLEGRSFMPELVNSVEEGAL